MIKLDQNLLSYFDCRKVRFDKTSLIERSTLDEIWGQKLSDILYDNETVCMNKG